MKRCSGSDSTCRPRLQPVQGLCRSASVDRPGRRSQIGRRRHHSSPRSRRAHRRSDQRRWGSRCRCCSSRCRRPVCAPIAPTRCAASTHRGTALRRHHPRLRRRRQRRHCPRIDRRCAATTRAPAHAPGSRADVPRGGIFSAAQCIGVEPALAPTPEVGRAISVEIGDDSRAAKAALTGAIGDQRSSAASGSRTRAQAVPGRDSTIKRSGWPSPLKSATCGKNGVRSSGRRASGSHRPCSARRTRARHSALPAGHPRRDRRQSRPIQRAACGCRATTRSRCAGPG